MLRSMNDLQDYTVGATDGHIGHVKDFYFDDATWVIRYLVVDTGSWLSSRKVLITPMSIDRPNWKEKALQVHITRQQVKDSPNIDTDKPVSRQHERDNLHHYGYPPYWGDGVNPSMAITGYPSIAPSPADGARSQDTFADVDEIMHRDDDPHLRSAKVVIGYHVEALDGEIGHVDGMLVDDETWAVRYLVVKAGNWWEGALVLVAPEWIKRMSASARTLSVDLTRDAVKHAPPYDPTATLDRQFEIDTYKHHGRTGYWPAP